MSYSDEVRICFAENPDVLDMSPVKLAEWFYIQGILYQSNVVAALDSKFIHFAKHMTKEQIVKARKEWNTVNNLGEKALEAVEAKEDVSSEV